MTDQNKNKKEGQPFEEKVLLIRRVSKKLPAATMLPFRL
jgi:hypothetical protein